MYRYLLTIDGHPYTQYINLDDDKTRFVTVVTGTPIQADIDHEREGREVGDGEAWLTAVFNPLEAVYVNNLTPEQAEEVYTTWWKESMP